MPPITNQQKRDFTKKIDAFEKKLASLTKDDIENVTTKQIKIGNITYTREVSEEIENMVKAYDELYQLDKATFTQTGEHLNEDRQMKAYYAACEKLGMPFWNRVLTGTPEGLVKSKIANSQNAVNSDDPKKAAESINDALHAVRRTKNWKSLASEIEKLYHAAENKFGYTVFNGTRLGFGQRLGKMGFNLQMESFEKMLESYDPNVPTDLEPFAVKYEAVLSSAQNDKGVYYDKDRCDKAFQAAVGKLGMEFCKHLSSVPQEFLNNEIDSFTMAVNVYDKSKNPEKAQNLTARYLDTVSLILKNDPSNKTSLVQRMYDAVKKKCGEAAADRIVEIAAASKKLPDLVGSIEKKHKEAKQNEQKKQAEQESTADFAWREKWKKPMEVVYEQFFDPALINRVLNARSAADKKNQPILSSDEDLAFLNGMATKANLLYNFAHRDYLKPIDEAVHSIYEDYALAREHYKEEISSGDVGSPLYQARLEALTACGAMGVMASRFISVAKANSLGFENVKDVDPMKTLRETLTVLRDEMERIPKSGNDTRLYTNLDNAIRGVIDNAGISLEELHTAAEQYFNARKGVIFSPFTAAGKQRLDIANRVIGFLDVVKYKKLDPMSKTKEDEPEVKAKNEVKENAKTEAPKSQVKTEAPKSQAKTEATKSQAKTEATKSQAKTEATKSQVKTEATKSQAKTEEPKSQAKTEAPKSQAKTKATNLSETVYDKIHDKCIELTRDKKILTFDQALAIDVKADAGTFAQKDYLNGLLDKENELKDLAQKYPDRDAFENALDGLLKELNNAPKTNAETAVNVGYALETNEAAAQQTTLT